MPINWLAHPVCLMAMTIKINFVIDGKLICIDENRIKLFYQYLFIYLNLFSLHIKYIYKTIKNNNKNDKKVNK